MTFSLIFQYYQFKNWDNVFLSIFDKWIKKLSPDKQVLYRGSLFLRIKDDQQSKIKELIKFIFLSKKVSIIIILLYLVKLFIFGKEIEDKLQSYLNYISIERERVNK